MIHTQFTLPDYLNSYSTSTQLPANGIYLSYDEQGLSLNKIGEKGKVQVDFVQGSARHRRLQGGGELIAKAVNHTSEPIVWDATGGLGRDAFVLASLGLSVCVFEQHPSIFALLTDGLMRALAAPQTIEIAKRIHLIHGNAITYLPKQAQLLGKPDVIYLDPMYPERQKSAAVKKEMAYFHELVGQNAGQNDAMLLSVAREYAKKRVVVKRPRLGLFLDNQPPAYQYNGKSTRFDVYLPVNVR